MLVNSTTASSMHPGDIHKLMSSSNKGKTSPTKSTNKSEIAIDGKTCREVNQVIIYSLLQSLCSSLFSLIDRGANGRIAGNDVRVICKDPSKTVNARGIDNYEITLMPLVAAGE